MPSHRTFEELTAPLAARAPGAIAPSPHRSPSPSLHARQVGNQAMSSPRRAGAGSAILVRGAGDPFEREADRVADAVSGGASSLPPISTLSGGEPAPGRASPEGGFHASGAFKLSLDAARGGGRPLDAGERQLMEGRFGRDFSDVRIHTGGVADTLSRDLHARAFTHGSDIFMRADRYAPGTPEGHRLLAHELTHVVQQEGGAAVQASSFIQRDTEEAATTTSAGMSAMDVGSEAAATGETAEALKTRRATFLEELKAALVDVGNNRATRTIEAVRGALAQFAAAAATLGDDRYPRLLADLEQTIVQVFAETPRDVDTALTPVEKESVRFYAKKEKRYAYLIPRRDEARRLKASAKGSAWYRKWGTKLDTHYQATIAKHHLKKVTKHDRRMRGLASHINPVVFYTNREACDALGRHREGMNLFSTLCGEVDGPKGHPNGFLAPIVESHMGGPIIEYFELIARRDW